MLEDRDGNALTTSSTIARDAYVEAVDLFLAAQSGVEAAFTEAIAADERFALAHVGLARVRQVMGQGAAARDAITTAQAVANGVSDREAGHLTALALLVNGKGPEAYLAIRKHLDDFPRDAMVAQPCTSVFGLIGFSGRPGREAEQLAFTTMLAPHYGDDWWFLAQHGFAQLEAGQIGPAEVTIERALQGHPRNAFAAHVRAHFYYEIGEAEAGYDYLAGWRRDYSDAAALHCHISWHMALWALEQELFEAMWQVVDDDMDLERSLSPPLNVLTDMASILYRAELAGVDVPPERWRAVSEYAARIFPEPGIAFADVHAALAHAMAGNGAALAKVIADATGPAGDMVRDAAEAFGAIAAGDWAAATGYLTKVMSDHARLGGSRAQRDLIEYAMLGVLLKQGLADEARRLLAIRRPLIAETSPVKGLS